MNRSATLSSAALALVAALIVAACSDEEPTRAGVDLLRAHTPARAASPLGGVSVAAVPAYAQLDDAAARGTAGSLHLSVNAGAAVPRFPDSFISSVAVFGYAWVDLASASGVVAVIHPAIGRDSRQNPDGWHTHPVQLTTGTAASDFCIASIGTSQGGISIRDDGLRLNMAQQQAGSSAGVLDVAVSFIVQPDGGCASGLGVGVLDAETL